MPRKSKYSAAHCGEQRWRCALYVRLSREDGDKAQSESIASQRDFLRAYIAAQPELCEQGVYSDDGYTGTDFDRPGFAAMLSGIESGLINCVLVRDLSRLGRNYVESGRLLETVFPARGVRFISVNDRIDSFSDPQSAASMLVPMKNVINDEYCRDISTKVRSSLDLRRRQGKFIGSFASYGYAKDPQDRHRLLVDEGAAPVVRSIFEWFLAGGSILGIARRLNALGIPSPAEYKRRLGSGYCPPNGGGPLWQDCSVRRILKNELYTGSMVQGRVKTVSYKVHLLRAVPEDEWIKVENTHEAIISGRDFAAAQRLLQRDTRAAPGVGEVGMFSGLLRCADCGRAMNKKQVPGKGYCYYICSTHKKSGACTKHTVRSDRLETAVLETLRKQIALCVDTEALLADIKKRRACSQSRRSVRTLLDIRLAEREKCAKMLRELYPDYKSGLLSRESYLALKSEYESRLELAEKAASELERTSEEEAAAPSSDFLSLFAENRSLTCLTRPVLTQLVDTIRVFEGGGIEIRFRFADEMREALEFIEKAGA